MGLPSCANAEYVSIGGSQMRLRTVTPRNVIGSNGLTVLFRLPFFLSSLIVISLMNRWYRLNRRYPHRVPTRRAWYRLHCKQNARRLGRAFMDCSLCHAIYAPVTWAVSAVSRHE